MYFPGAVYMYESDVFSESISIELSFIESSKTFLTHPFFVLIFHISKGLELIIKGKTHFIMENPEKNIMLMTFYSFFINKLGKIA